MEAMQTYAILFVCTGNICRSPTAEAIARDWLYRHQQTERFLVDSAGTSGYHVGEAPDARTQLAARRHGYDLAPLRARQLELADYQRFDLLLAMDEGHLRFMREHAPAVYRPKLRLFLSFSELPEYEREVSDPYYGGAQGFENVIAQCELGVEALFAQLHSRIGLRAAS